MAYKIIEKRITCVVRASARVRGCVCVCLCEFMRALHACVCDTDFCVDDMAKILDDNVRDNSLSPSFAKAICDYTTHEAFQSRGKFNLMPSTQRHRSLMPALQSTENNVSQPLLNCSPPSFAGATHSTLCRLPAFITHSHICMCIPVHCAARARTRI